MNMKKVAIIQPNYIPWKGYFDIINSVDIFILYDDVQYTIRDWRNRNKIKTNKGSEWLTIPVILEKSYFHYLIKDVKIVDKDWGKKHWNKIKQYYSKANYFKEYKDLFEELYLNSKEEYLWEIDVKFISVINNILGIKTKIILSSELNIPKSLKKTERLLEILKKINGNIYLSGPSSKNYLDENLLNENGIAVEWMDYSGYPEYTQLFPPFIHEVSIIDLIYNEGKNAPNYMKSFKRG